MLSLNCSLRKTSPMEEKLIIRLETSLVFLALSLIAGLGCGAVPKRVDPPLVACSNLLHPPFSSRDASGRPVGIEVEIVAQAARRLGRDVEWIERPFGELLDAVALGEADLAAATIGITDERARLVAFTRPYFETTIVALVRQGKGEPATLDQLAGRRVATDRGTTAVGATAARIPEAIGVLERPAGTTWAGLLAAGEVDAVVLDRSHAEIFMRDAGQVFDTIAEPLRIERFGIAVHEDALELRAALDEVILERSEAARISRSSPAGSLPPGRTSSRWR